MVIQIILFGAAFQIFFSSDSVNLPFKIHKAFDLIDVHLIEFYL